MPTSITHQILAEEVYKALPPSVAKEIASLPHYYLGAQGCDVCFLYRWLSTPKARNLGRVMHAFRPLLFFQKLKEQAERDVFARSYAYGYITHYAADVVFHPYVYAQLGGREGTLRHHALEHAFDGRLLKKYKGVSLAAYRLPVQTNVPLGGVFTAYARYAEESGWGRLGKRAFLRAVKAHRAVSAFRAPFYQKRHAACAEKLFDEAKALSLCLAEKFFLRSAENLSAKDFGRHYLTGKIVK